MFRGRARRFQKSGVSAETLENTALPMIEVAAAERGLGAAWRIQQELCLQGYFEQGLVEQWHSVAAALWKRMQGEPEVFSRLVAWSAHPEARVRFFAPFLWSRWGLEEDAMDLALEALLPLADDSDFRVLEATQAFGLRPFAHGMGADFLSELVPWFFHPSPRVRRTAVTAVRPRGFWVRHLPWAVECPQTLMPMLEAFGQEEERFPANAVANCINDISHRDPQLCFLLFKHWQKEGWGMQCEHMMRKGLRSLLKAGEPQAMAALGLEPVNLELRVSMREGEVVAPNTNLHFDLKFHNPGSACRIELIFEIQTPGRHPKRPRRKKYQGGQHTIPPGTSELTLRERIFDRKAAPLLAGESCVRFFANGHELAELCFQIERPRLPKKIS